MNTTDAVYRALIKYKIEHDGASPSIRELTAVMGFTSTTPVEYHLKKLEKQGLIKRQTFGRARNICVVGGRWVPPAQVHILADGPLSPETASAINNMVQATVAAVVEGRLGHRRDFGTRPLVVLDDDAGEK